MTKKEYYQQYALKNKEKLRIYNKKYRDKNKKTIQKKKQEYYKKNKEYILLSNEKRRFYSRYKITIEEKAIMLQSQGGKCAICEKQILLKDRNTHVDHDHKTGKVRAILCLQCNGMIGHANDNIERLRAAIKYLEMHT